MSRIRTLTTTALFLLCIALLGGCEEARQPDYVKVVVLKGTPYERGVQHGELLGHRIRSLYATLLPNSLMPYLNREQTDVADVLFHYRDDPDDGVDSYFETWRDACIETCVERCTEKCGFSYLLMLDSGREMEKLIPEEYLEEMRGIADGSGMPYEEVLILNTFLDTMLAFRSITFFIRQIQAPYVEEVAFVGADKDGNDNNGDGEIDEEGEGLAKPYPPGPYALFVEVSPDATLRLVLKDRKIPLSKNPNDIMGVSPDSIRIQLNDTIYTALEHPKIVRTKVLDSEIGSVEVRFTPPGGFPEKAVSSVIVQAGDLSQSRIQPVAAKFMRDERITFSTAGYGKFPHEIPNRGLDDGRTQPPSIAFAVRNTAAKDTDILHAHHYALLDSNVTHKHTALFVHIPEDGEPHAVLGYSGLVWGFSGMNQSGLAYSFNNSDSLDNAMVGRVRTDLFEAFLVAEGVPVGIAGREMLQRNSRVREGVDYLKGITRTFGWNYLLTDARGDMAVVEVDANVYKTPDGGVVVYRPDADKPENLDAWGRLPSSLSGDDIRVASHYALNLNDVPPKTNVLGFDVTPQHVWTSFYFRSLRVYYNLADAMEARLGEIDVPTAIEILRIPELVDDRDSMMAVIFEPKARMLYYAMGDVPATREPFVAFDLAAVVRKEVAR